ncbi:hypothetical protein F5051DRAFT_434115 [Lentinula edodes]|nr:hypothetical protein F5051DRAFT_434115 [Lentinula edodes]
MSRTLPENLQQDALSSGNIGDLFLQMSSSTEDLGTTLGEQQDSADEQHLSKHYHIPEQYTSQLIALAHRGGARDTSITELRKWTRRFRGGLFEINSPDVESLNKLRKHQKEMMLRIDKHAEIQTETLNQLKIMNEGNTKRDSQLQRQEGQLQRQEAQMAELQRTQEQILSHLHLASPLASTTRAVPVNTSFDPSRPFAPAAGGVNTQSSCKTWVKMGLRRARSRLELEGSYENRDRGRE